MVVAVESAGKLVEEFAPVLRDDAGRFFATAELFSELHLPKPAGTAIAMGGTLYFPLDAAEGMSYRFDETEQKLTISLPPPPPSRTSIELGVRPSSIPDRTERGFFFNHDIQAVGAGNQSSASTVEEIAFFSQSGVLSARGLAPDLVHGRGIRRVDTQFTRDFPDRMKTLTVGDAVTSPGIWGLSVNYAGVRWASKFATRPSFIPYSLPGLSGQAAQPSTVDLYVNNAQVSRQSIPAGPFDIRNIPILTPQGDVRMVVTDLTGRQQVVSAAYISTPQLLRKGVTDFAYEAGSLRTGFGVTSVRYQSMFAAATRAHGVTDSVTFNFHGELHTRGQTFGAGLDAGVLPIGTIGAGAAVSRDAEGRPGALAYTHIQHATRGFSFSLSSQMATTHFQQLGLIAGGHASQFIGQAQVTQNLEHHMLVSLAYMYEEKPDVPAYNSAMRLVNRFSTVNPSLTLNLPHGCYLVGSGFYSPQLQHRPSATVMLVVPLGRRHMAVSSVDYSEAGASPSIEYSQQIREGIGWGYRARASTLNGMNTPRIDLGATYQGSTGSYQLEADQQSGSPTGWRSGYSGSTLFMHGQFMQSRSLTSGFAVVNTSGAPGIPVLANNQYVAKTNGHGFALVPNLSPYSPNTISLGEDTPDTLDVEYGEKKVVPMPRSGVFVDFKAKRITAALLKLVAEDGADIPIGATVTINGNTYEVVLHGEVYVPDISFPASLHVVWEGKACDAVVLPSDESKKVMPHLGPIICRGRQ